MGENNSNQPATTTTEANLSTAASPDALCKPASILVSSITSASAIWYPINTKSAQQARSMASLDNRSKAVRRGVEHDLERWSGIHFSVMERSFCYMIGCSTVVIGMWHMLVAVVEIYCLPRRREVLYFRRDSRWGLVRVVERRS